MCCEPPPLAVGRALRPSGGAGGVGVDTVPAVIPLEQAQHFVLSTVTRAQPVRVPRAEAVGRVLAVDVVAGDDVPPFDNTAVDGFAVRADDVADVPVDLTVVATVAAGDHTDRVLGAGEAIRIMTGAPMPAGADAVVMVEDSEMVSDDVVRLSATVPAGAAVRRAAEDVAAGDTVLHAGTEITPAVLGVLATINVHEVDVFPAPRVAVASTGDELVVTDAPLLPGQIRESNRPMLLAALRDAGCEVTDLGVIPDDEDRLAEVLTAAAGTHDAVVTSGGVSMGDFDVVKAVLGRIADMTWMQVAIKPAKPFAFGVLDGTPVFGLPGNPVSSLVSFEMFARPALRAMAGHERLSRPSVVAIVDDDLRRGPDGKTHLMRVQAHFADDGRCHVVPVRAQGSHQLAATATATAIAVVPDGDGLPAGSEVAVLLLR